MYQVLTFRNNKDLVTCISLFLLFSLSNLIFYTPLFAKPQNEDGYLILQTKYRGLSVKIDGKFVGYTRPDAFLLPAGKHSLSVSHPDGDNWLVSDWIEQIVIFANDKTSVNVSFDKSYS